MTEDCPFAFAPAAVLRVASWPLDAITQLDAPELAALAQRAQPGAVGELASGRDSAECAALAQAYDAQLEHARAKLWASTAACPRFRAALALSSPALHRRLGAGELPLRRNKSARHLETSLYRYLARAATRIEPFGLWTGVGLAHLEADPEQPSRCEHHAARVRLAPELGPLRTILLALSHAAPYRERGPWRLNPTLSADQAGVWRYARRDPSTGELRWSSLSAGLGESLSRVLADAAGSLSQLRARAQLVAGSELADELVSLALRAGLLVGGLDLPLRYGDAWEALRLAEALLTDEHAARWAQLREQMRERCEALRERLELEHGEDTPAAALGDAIVSLEDELAELVGELARALGVPEPAAPRSWVRCDLGAAWTLGLGRLQQARLRQLATSWVELERAHERAAAREERARVLLHRFSGVGLMAHEAMRSGGAQLEPAEGEAHTDGELDAGPPLAALIVRPGDAELASGWVRGLSEVPTATHARHAHHLAELGDPLLPWFQAQFAQLSEAGHEPVDLGYSHAGSPNLLARPRYVASVRGPWSAEASTMLERDASLVAGPRPGALLIDTRRGRISLHAFTATVVPPSDPILARLTLSSFDRRSSGVNATGAAQDGAKHRPHTLGGLTLTPRSVELSPAQVEALAAVRHLPRYLCWLALARTLELPELVRVQIAARPGLVVPTRSPLAIQAAFEGLRAGASVRVEVVIERGIVPSPRGRHIAELVLPLRRHKHLWRRPQSQEHRHAHA